MPLAPTEAQEAQPSPPQAQEPMPEQPAPAAEKHAAKHGRRYAKSKKPLTKKEKRALNNITRLFLNIITTVLVVWVAITYVFGFYVQSGEDMYPRVRDGDLVLFYRMENDYYIDDVITFTLEGTRYTARYVAMAGDVVNITEEGQLVINGSVQQEEIFYATFQTESGLAYPYTVPENTLFVLGDFRTSATDSRTFGAVSLDDIDGKLITIIRRRGI